MTPNRNESISVIIPAYNSASYIGEAIESVLEQSVKPYEIIVVDDGSTDDTKEVVRNYNGNIRYIYQENGGAASARNRGIEIAGGELIGFLDSDDIWLKNKLEIQVNLLRQHPEYEVVIGLLYRIPISRTDEVMHTEITDGEYATSVGSSLLKREVFEKIGNFDEKLEYCEDVDLFLRILESKIKVWGHKDVVQLYRRHKQNLTLDKKRSFHSLLRVFKKTMGRRRGTGKQLPNFENMGKIMEFWETNQHEL